MTRELPSGLVLDETLLAKERKAQEDADRAKAAEQGRAAIRTTLREALASLETALGRHGQTTHASLFGRGADIKIVAESLTRCWDDPRHFTVSELSQCIHGFLKAHTA